MNTKEAAFIFLSEGYIENSSGGGNLTDKGDVFQINTDGELSFLVLKGEKIIESVYRKFSRISGNFALVLTEEI